MTNNERADKWYGIITSLTDITKTTASLKTWLIASHYIAFATEMWMTCIYKDMREGGQSK